MDKGVAAAQRRFPKRGQAIEQLAARDEEFYEMCVDFADAEAALQSWQKSTNPLRDQRCAEYAEMINYLSDEMETALDKAAVLPFKPRRPRPGM